MSDTNLNDASFTPEIQDSEESTNKQTYSATGSFRFWCQKVLPLVYDDSLSYYELLCKVVNYLNNVIQNVDNLNTSVDNTNTAFDNLQNYVNTTKDTLVEAYGELEQYVNDYFNNLDVQGEINAKLDVMASDGSLSSIISPFIPSLVSDWLSDNITPTSPAIDASLSVSGAGADAKVTGDKLSALNDHLSLYTGISVLNGWVQNKIIVTNQSVGTTISLEPIDKNYGEYNIVDCIGDELFTINGESASETRLYCFIDADNKILLNTYVTSLTNGIIKAPATATRLIINRWINTAVGYCYRGEFIPETLQRKANKYKYLETLADFANSDEGLYAVNPATQNIPQTFGGYGWLDVHKTTDGKTIAALFRERGLPVFYAYNTWYRMFNTQKFACIGDSWTEFNSTGDRNWIRLLEAEGAICQNLGVGGTGFAKHTDSGSIYKERISQIENDALNIIIIGSFNDMTAGVDIGSPTDTGTNSVMGYVNDFFDELLTSYGSRNIYCISPAPWRNYHYGVGRSDSYVLGLEEICRKNGIPFLNCYNTTNLRPWNNGNLSRFYTNDSHVNNNGYELLYAKYRQFILENMVRFY